MSYFKLIATRHPCPVSRTKSARNHTPALGARKVQTRQTRNVRAEILRLTTRADQLRARRRDIRTNITTDQRDNLLALRARARHIDIMDIANLDARRVAGARARRRLVALIYSNRDLAGLAVEVLESDVARVARAATFGRRLARGAAEGFDAGAVFGVNHGDVLYEDVGHNIFCAGVLAQGADGNAVRALAVEVFDEDVGCVGFEGDAVVAVDNVDVGYSDGGAAVDVPARGVVSGVVRIDWMGRLPV
jgi:hypothetical protein